MRFFLSPLRSLAALSFVLIICTATAQTNAEKFPYPGDPQAQAATTPAQPAKPLIAPKGTLQSNPHTAEVKVFDPPCLVPSDGNSYGYTMQRGAPARSAEIKTYFWDMRKNIYDHWLLHMPRMASRPWLKKGTVGVKATIEKDGTVETPFVTLSSPHEGFDDHVVKSLEEMSPLPPLPAGTESLRVCLFFGYNMENPSAPEKHDYDGWLDKPATK